MPAISSTAARNGLSFPFDGLLNPLIFLTYWSEAARTSSSVTGGSKLKRVLIFLHIPLIAIIDTEAARGQLPNIHGDRPALCAYFLEDKLQAQLQTPWIGGRGDTPESERIHIRIRFGENRRVGEVEEFATELEPKALGEIRVLK